MRTTILLTLLALFGCASTPPDSTPAGYEKTTTGSGCRDTKTGEYVSAEKCAS